MFGRIFGSFAVKIQSVAGWITGGVTLIQGSGVTLTQDTTARTITIASTGGGGGGLQMGTSLPVANAGNRGVLFLLLGATSFPDVLYICTKDYQDNYGWNEIPLMTP